MFENHHLNKLFKSSPLSIILLFPDAPHFTIADVNTAYLKATNTQEKNLVGKPVFETFPDNTEYLTPDVVCTLRQSLLTVISTGKPQTIALQTHEHESTPVFDKEGNIAVIIHSVTGAAGKEVQQEKQQQYEMLPGSITDQNETAQLKSSEHQYRSLFEQNLAGLYQSTLDGVIVKCNDAFVKMLKYDSQKELLEINASELYFSSAPRNDFIKNVIDQKKLYNYEGILKCKDGSALHFLENISLGKDAMTGEIFLYGILIDISKRKKAEVDLVTTSEKLKQALSEQVVSHKKIEESETRYRELIRELPVATYSCDPEGRILIYNKAAAALWGKEPETGKDLWCGSWKLYNVDGTPLPLDACPMAIALKEGRAITDQEIIIERPNGDRRNVVPHPVLITDSAGRLTGVINMLTDITENKIAQHALKENERKYRQIVETGQEGIWMIDINQQTIFVNKKMCEILGYTEAEMMGRTNLSFKDPEEQKIALQQIERRKKGLKETHESKFITKSGKNIWTQVSTNPLLAEDGSYMGALAMITDITERKQAELQLKESNQRYDYVTKATFDAIWDWDLITDTIYWGEGLHTLFGYNPHELKTDISSWTDYIHPADIDRTVKGIYELINGTQTNWVDEYRYLKADQTYAYVMDKGFVIRDEQGKAIRMVGARQDITDKKALEDLLDKATKLARIGGWEMDLLKGTVYWSNVTKEIHETERDFIPDLQTVINFYKEGDTRELISQKMKDAIEKGIQWDVELQIITARGNEKWIRSIGETESVNGKCVRVYGSFQDIDARKKAELAVTEAFEEKNIILESIGDAFFAVDKNWTVTYWNNQAEKMLKIPNNEIVGHHLWEIFPDSTDSESYKKYHQAIETNEVVHFEDYYATLTKWYEISAYPSGNGLSIYFKDVTDRKLSQILLAELNENLQRHAKELAISNAELEQFAYVASHDLQEPLRMVTGFLTQLEKKYGDVIDEKGKKYIGFAVDGAKRMRQIILDLLEFSRVGRTEDNRENIALNELVNEIQLLFRKQIEDKNALIQVDELPVVSAYKAPLRQVFQNLISNALKYARPDTPSRIHITVKAVKNYWQFAVTDNGIGIAAEYFDKIFIIFQRLHNKDEFSGTGMGLAVAKKIIENLGGKIWVESEEGKGSTFYFTLLK